MDYLIIVLFVTPIVLATLMMTIIVKYLKSKAAIKRNFQIQIQIDLAVVTLMYVILYSSMFITCELFGPSRSVTTVNIALWILQCLFNIGFNCIITLEFIQLYNIFSLTILNEYSEYRHLLISQIFVFALGVMIGSGLCFVGTGSCKKTAIYNYFIIESLRSTEDKYSLLSGITWLSYGIIILFCQLSIEIKRYTLNKADEKMDNMAINATKKIYEARSKLKIQAPVELGIHNLLSDAQPSEQGLYSKHFNHLKESIVSTTIQSKVIPNYHTTPSASDCQKHRAIQEPSKDIQYHENKIRAPQLLNTVDEIVLLEEFPVNEGNQTIDPVNNLRKRGSENGDINVLGTSQVPNQFKFNARYTNDKFGPTETHQMPSLNKQNKRSSRDQVNLNSPYKANFLNQFERQNSCS